MTTGTELIMPLRPYSRVNCEYWQRWFSALPTVAPGSLDDPPALLAELLTRLHEFDTEQLGGPAWLDLDGVARAVGPLYREPTCHAVPRSAP